MIEQIAANIIGWLSVAGVILMTLYCDQFSDGNIDKKEDSNDS